jgi:hypothetical protein
MKTYEDGLNEAWELARKIGGIDNGYTSGELSDIFGTCSAEYIFDNLTISKTMDAIENSERIKVGDEVVNKYGWKRVVTNTHINGEVTLMDSNGDFYAYCRAEVNALDLKKTGRHFSQIEEVLQQIKEEDKGE